MTVKRIKIIAIDLDTGDIEDDTIVTIHTVEGVKTTTLWLTEDFCPNTENINIVY